MPEIGGDDLGAACALVLECYNRATLDQLMRLRFNLPLETVVREASLTEQVAELFDFAVRHRLSGRLLQEAAEFPPPKEKLRALVEKYPADSATALPSLSVLVGDAIGGFAAIRQRLGETAVRQRFSPFVGAYQNATVQIDLLRRYKRLHDCLQNIQLKQPAIELAAEAVDRDPSVVANLYEYADSLADAEASVREVVAGLPNPPREQTWTTSLRRAAELLRSGAERRQGADCRQAIYLLGRILEYEPGRLQGLILRHSDAIPFASLVFSLRAIGDVPGEGWRKTIEPGLTAMEKLQLRLAALVAEHTAWQSFDNSLRLVRDSWRQIVAFRPVEPAPLPGSKQPGPLSGPNRHSTAATAVALELSQLEYVERMIEDWADVWIKLEGVRAVAVARDLERLVVYAEKIQQAVATKSFGVIFDLFEPFSILALRRFVEVDLSLLGLVNELTHIGEPVRVVVEMIQS